MAYVGIATMAQVQHDVLGKGGHAVVSGGVVHQVEDVEDLSSLEVAADLDLGHPPARLWIST
jgi:hypothetical protein